MLQASPSLPRFESLVRSLPLPYNINIIPNPPIHETIKVISFDQRIMYMMASPELIEVDNIDVPGEFLQAWL